MNALGRILRVEIYGESHGDSVGVNVDGCPAGLPVNSSMFAEDLDRRRGGGAGSTARVEEDRPLIDSGVHDGRSTGAPILMRFPNRDTDPSSYSPLVPRPGHGDLAARMKFGGFNDPGGGGHMSGRLTVGLVAAGVIAKQLLGDVRVEARLVSVHGSDDIGGEVRRALERSDSVGGRITCRVSNVPAGLGEPFFDSVESLLAHALLSIPGIKGVEFGAGFGAEMMYGSEFNDPVTDRDGTTSSNNSGGINGGITNGNPLVFSVVMRPTSTVGVPQSTVDLGTGRKVELVSGGRHDTCIALRTPVIVEAVSALVLADLMLLEHRIPRVWGSTEG